MRNHGIAGLLAAAALVISILAVARTPPPLQAQGLEPAPGPWRVIAGFSGNLESHNSGVGNDATMVLVNTQTGETWRLVNSDARGSKRWDPIPRP